MYDLHPDLLLWLEPARQRDLQRKVALQVLLRQAHRHSPQQRGQAWRTIGQNLRSIGLKLRALLSRRPAPAPIMPVQTPHMTQEDESDDMVATRSMPRVLEKTTV